MRLGTNSPARVAPEPLLHLGVQILLAKAQGDLVHPFLLGQVHFGEDLRQVLSPERPPELLVPGGAVAAAVEAEHGERQVLRVLLGGRHPGNFTDQDPVRL